MTKKRKVVESHESPPPSGDTGWSPWAVVAGHEDAPTIKLDAGDEKADDFGFSSFAQLGSVLDKMPSFNKRSTLSTISSESMVPISMPLSTIPEAELPKSTVKQLVKKFNLETSNEKLSNRFSRVYDSFNRFSVPKCQGAHVMSFCLGLFESITEAWGAMEIPGPFGSIGRIIVRSRTDGSMSLAVSGVQLKNDRLLSEELKKFGLETLEVEKNDEEDEKIKFSDRGEIFGFFDFLKDSEIVKNAYRPSLLVASFPFRDASYSECEVGVSKSAQDESRRIIQIDKTFVPWFVVESFMSNYPADSRIVYSASN
jgi:hypothetical protein